MARSNKKLNQQLQDVTWKEDFIPFRIKRLIKKGANPNLLVDEYGTTLLMEEAERGYYLVVNALIKNGADVNIATKYGVNALMSAAKRNNPDIIKLLIKKGADVNAQSKNGNNALVYATANQSGDEILDNIKVLLELGADINQINESGNSVLHFAVSEGHYNIVKYLLEKGADTKLSSIPLMQLVETEDENGFEIIELLKASGVKPVPFAVQYKSNIECPDCANLVSLNGPAQMLQCNKCLTQINIVESVWESILSSSKYWDTSFESLIENKPVYSLKVEIKRMLPICSNDKCETELPIDLNISGKDSSIICPNCKTENITYPVPESFKKYIVSGLRPSQIFGGDKFENKIVPPELKAVPVNCISCGASMKISLETPRMCTCEHCSTQQYLPDGIWKKLHPIKTRKAWYIYFKSEHL